MAYHRWCHREDTEGMTTLTVDLEGGCAEKKRALHISQQSSILLPMQTISYPSQRYSSNPASPTSPISPVYALPYLPPSHKRTSSIPTTSSATYTPYGAYAPKRFSGNPTPTSTSFSSYIPGSSPVDLVPNPTTQIQTSATPFTNPSNIYAIPPLPHHWSSNPPVQGHTRQVSNPLTPPIPEEIVEDWEFTSDRTRKRASARLSKPSRNSRMTSL